MPTTMARLLVPMRIKRAALSALLSQSPVTMVGQRRSRFSSRI